MKKLAAAAGAKDAAMLPAAEAERITGYHVGGISAFGQSKRVQDVYRRGRAGRIRPLIVNGGRRGLQIEIAPDDAGARARRAQQPSLVSGTTPPRGSLPTGCPATR